MDPTDKTTQTEPGSERSAVWMRGLYMLILVFAFGIAQSLLYLTALVQFLWLLATAEPNRLLSRFGSSLSLWLAETARFLCCASDEKPFPWKAWPAAE
jgi:hypothetical protein